jgi:hypothetical protein
MDMIAITFDIAMSFSRDGDCVQAIPDARELRTLDQRLQDRRAFAENRVSVVEGTIEHLDFMPFEGQRSERFSVNGVSFSYSDYSIDPGFISRPLMVARFAKDCRCGSVTSARPS